MTWAAIRAFARTLPLKTWLALAAIIVFAVLLTAYCSSRKEVGQLKDQGTLADARTKSAQDAIAAIADNQFVNAELRSEAERAQDAIRQADPADRDRVARCELRKLQGDPSPC
ncbi:MAG TPA: hypothetical protein PL098_00150 [Brevundimonas diminuta]|nr:hypothetical protein [Brevundimonas diminuta]HRL23315.1 hypothetical protein [Brevundimonas diminuta]